MPIGKPAGPAARKPPRVVMLSTSLAGGAGGAAYRLLQDLQARGLDARMLVEDDAVGRADPAVIRAARPLPMKVLRRWAHRLGLHPLARYPGRSKALFSPQWLPVSSLPGEILRLAPDIVHLHWVCGGWMGIRALTALRGRPIVWTLHDLWPFTGGCHFNDGCDRYRAGCGACPLLGSSAEADLSRRVLERKKRAWRGLQITAVAPSAWLADCARASALFRSARVEVIANGIDLQHFRPFDRRAARELLGLPQEKRIVLFGAWSNEPRKGLRLLAAALERLAAGNSGLGSGGAGSGGFGSSSAGSGGARSGAGSSLELAVFGFDRPPEARLPEVSAPGFPVRYLGRLQDAISLRAAYAAADVFAVPSTQDNLPTMAIEAIACGTPCVGFRTGGIPDIIEHEVNGYLAEPFDPADLARGIEWVLADEKRHRRLSAGARAIAEARFSRLDCAARYEALYAELARPEPGVSGSPP